MLVIVDSTTLRILCQYNTSIWQKHSSSNVENSFVSNVKFADYFFKLRIRCFLLCDGVGIVGKRST